MHKFVSFIIALITLLVLDGLWLGIFAKKFYQDHIGDLMADKINWVAAGLFYPLFTLGLMYFVIWPGLANQNFKSLLIGGALFGLVAYATYDLTNLATLKNWSTAVTIADLIWGSLVSALVSGITYWLVNKF